MNSLSLKSRNGFGRSLRFESLESRRLLSADLSVGVAHAAKLVHHESSDAAEVGKADPSGDTHVKGSGKHSESSGADHISSTSHVKVHAALSAAKFVAMPAISKVSSKTAVRHDDSSSSSDRGSVKSKTDDSSSTDISGSSTTDDHGKTEKEHSGTSSKEKHPETEPETETSDNSSSLS